MLANVRQTALRLLARRDHSYHELQQKLLQRGYAADDVTEILQKLAAQKLLNETRFIDSYIYARANKGYGSVRIAMELAERGIDKNTAAAQLANCDINWLENAKRVRNKRFDAQLPTDITEKMRQMQFLQYRGFTMDQIKQVFTQHEDA